MSWYCISWPDGSTPSVYWAKPDGSGWIVRNCNGIGGSHPVSDLQTLYPTASISKTAMEPGKHYPRIYRPWGEGPLQMPEVNNREWLSSVQAVKNLLWALDNQFRYLEPHPKNKDAFGHELRQLLILACTEVESSCKAVLKANNYSTPGNWATRDYVKLMGPLRLREWDAYLQFHPEYPTIAPFATWNDASPTQSLPWYDAYNAVKHDREDNFQRATLEHVISAMSAAYVLVVAQFGLFQSPFATLGHAFEVRQPIWNSGEFYAPPWLEEGATWTPVHHAF
jgi:hypothetical protein